MSAVEGCDGWTVLVLGLSLEFLTVRLWKACEGADDPVDRVAGALRETDTCMISGARLSRRHRITYIAFHRLRSRIGNINFQHLCWSAGASVSARAFGGPLLNLKRVGPLHSRFEPHGGSLSSCAVLRAKEHDVQNPTSGARLW